MVFVFRDKSAANIFLLLLLSILVHIHFLFIPPTISTDLQGGVIGIFFQRYLSHLNSLVIILIYQALLLLQAIRLNMLLNNFKMFSTSSYTVAMSYILLSGFFSAWFFLSPAMVAAPIILWIFVNLTRLFNNAAAKTLLFNTGMLTGLCIIGYHPTVYLIALVFFALAIIRPFKISEWLVLATGILMPFYFLAALCFLTSDLQSFIQFIPRLNFVTLTLTATSWFWACAAVLLLLFLCGIYFWQSANSRMVILIRKNWSILLVMLLLALPVPFLFNNGNWTQAWLYLIPLSAFIAQAFIQPRRLTLPNILFWISIMVVAYNNWLLIKK